MTHNLIYILFYFCHISHIYRKYYNAIIEDIDKDWDICYDVYFYMKCDTEFRGSVQFSRVWTNMLIFGIDSDAIRQASENGIWKLNTKQSNNFLIKGANPSITSSMVNDDDINEQDLTNLVIDEEIEQ